MENMQIKNNYILSNGDRLNVFIITILIWSY